MAFKKNRAAPPRVESPDVQKALEAIVSALNGQSDEIAKLNGSVTLASSTPGFIKAISFQMPSAPPYKTLTVESAWVSAASILMSPGGRASLHGLASVDGPIIGPPTTATPSSTGAGTALISSLPAGHLPAVGTELRMHRAVNAAGVNIWGLVGLGSVGLYIADSDGSVGVTAVQFDGIEWFAGLNGVCAAPYQFVGAGWPIMVQHDFPKCRGLVVLGCTLVGQSGANVGQGTPHVDWQDAGAGRLRINGIWGLQWGSKYQMLLYLSPEAESETA